MRAVLSNTGGIVFRTYWKCVRAVLSNGIVIMFLQCTIKESQTSRTSACIEQRNVQPPGEDAEGKGVEGGVSAGVVHHHPISVLSFDVPKQ